MKNERIVRRALIIIALLGLAAGAVAYAGGEGALAHWIWAAATVPVVIALAGSITRDLLQGRMGVDAIAFLSMTAALALGQSLAGVVVAIMYAGGTVLEDFAVARAERSLKALVDRAPRTAHRRVDESVEDVPIEEVKIGDSILVRAGEIIPVDGLVASKSAVIDQSALTGEPIPVTRHEREDVRSGTLNAGETFSMKAVATAGESTYAGIVRLVTAAQTARAPFIRLADRYALFLVPVTILVAGGAWLLTGEAIRGLAVLVVATPCPLILAAPVAFIAGVSQAAGRGILIKGGAALEALARTHTVLFDKTGTLTVGGARLIAVETAPGESADAAETIGAGLDLDAVLSDRVPSDKVDAVVTERRLHPTLMVGDGINDAPALAAADVGIALGARGASASSEAADVVILVDRLDRVSEAVAIARRTRHIALQSIVSGMALSGIAMGIAAFGWLTPVAGAITQEVIDVAVILNALRALSPPHRFAARFLPAKMALTLHQEHERLEQDLDQLRSITDALDDASGQQAVDLIAKAHRIVEETIVSHERGDESTVYPRLRQFLADSQGLSAMSRAHREILHLARLLARLTDGLHAEDADKYLVRDAQRVIESIEALVRIHNAQEEDIYEHAAAA